MLGINRNATDVNGSACQQDKELTDAQNFLCLLKGQCGTYSVKTYRKDCIPASEGEVADKIFFVVDDEVGTSRTTPCIYLEKCEQTSKAGERIRLQGVCGPGDHVSGLEFIYLDDFNTREYQLRVVRDCKVLVVSMKCARALAHDNLDFSRWVGSVVSRLLQEREEYNNFRLSGSVAERIDSIPLRLARMGLAQVVGPAIYTALTHEMIARVAGASRESLNNALKKRQLDTWNLRSATASDDEVCSGCRHVFSRKTVKCTS